MWIRDRTYGAYLYLNGDDNDSLTTFAQRSAGQKIHSMNMSYGGSGGSANSASCVKLGELADKGVLLHLLQAIVESDQLVTLLHAQKFMQLVPQMVLIEDQVTHPQMNMLLSQHQVVSILIGALTVSMTLYTLMRE